MAQARLTEEIIFTKTQKEALYGALLGVDIQEKFL